ncbi:alpha/beta hydrolase [Sphaerisporangium sp. NPDC005288]|uniref:alpha/beta fold hydrolase n=1 Tax=Sphaerisporangium sp. NPDC005288 TaxID=3155114 RepID=UPI0033AA66DD
MLTEHDVPPTRDVRLQDGVPTRSIPYGRDGRLAVTEWGDPYGTPVFFFHGTPGCRVGPLPKTSFLFRHRIRLICYDRPGYGRSTRREKRAVSDGADQVRTIADRLGIERFAVVGRSGGGPHALACAALLRERVTKAATLVTLAPPDEGPDGMGRRWYDDMAPSNIKEYEAASQGTRYFTEFLEPRAQDIREKPTSLIRGFFHELPQSDRRIVMNAVVRKSLTQGYEIALKSSFGGWVDDAVAFRNPWGFDLALISAPVRLWHGADDIFSPVSHTGWLAEKIRGAEPLIQQGVGHFSAIYALPSLLTWLTAGASSFARPAYCG